jgi:hypothetical protein
MPRTRIVGLLACLVALTVVFAGTTAQEASPSTAPASVTREPLTSAAVSRLEGVAGPLAIERVRIPAGAETLIDPGEATLLVLVVESGTLDVESPSAVTIQRAATGEDTAPAETVAAHTALALAQGESLVSLAPGGIQLHNSGPETTSLITIDLGSSAAAATPAATTEEAADHGLVMAVALVVPPPCPPGTEPGSPSLAATPGAGGGGGGAGGVALAFAAAPACIDVGATPVP